MLTDGRSTHRPSETIDARSDEHVVPQRARARHVEPAVAFDQDRCLASATVGGTNNFDASPCVNTLSPSPERSWIAAGRAREIDGTSRPRILDHSQHERVGAHENAVLEMSRIDRRVDRAAVEHHRPGKLNVFRIRVRVGERHREAADWSACCQTLSR